MATINGKLMLTSLRTGEDSLEIIDQLLLPHVVEYIAINSVEDAFDAIKQMKIRGAPAIASLAALTISLLLTRRLKEPSSEQVDVPESTATAYHVPSLTSPSVIQKWLDPSLEYLLSSRPTAVNLGEAINRIKASSTTFLSSYESSKSGSDEQGAKAYAEAIVKTCQEVHANDLERNKEMSRLGADWIWKRSGSDKTGKKLRVMTVCNTGSLATSGYGTALGVITALFEQGRLERAYYTQSTPYHQGSRLTSLELSTLEIPACMICDTMVGSLFQHETIDLVVVGADRVVKNGDTANKIGTYQAATLAKRHGIPFMVAAPVTTLDLSIETGKGIHIEQRPPVEATMARGLNKETGSQSVVQITPNGIGQGSEPWQMVYNPSFDVTPAELITAVVTEKGLAVNDNGGDAIDLSNVC